MSEDHPSGFTEQQKEEIGLIVASSIDCYFQSKGKLGKQIIVGTAIVIGSLTVIFGGFKVILGWLGFTYMRP